MRTHHRDDEDLEEPHVEVSAPFGVSRAQVQGEYGGIHGDILLVKERQDERLPIPSFVRV